MTLKTVCIDIDNYRPVTICRLSRREMTLAYEWSNGDLGVQKVSILMAGISEDQYLGEMGKPELLDELMAHPEVLDPLLTAILDYSEPFQESAALRDGAMNGRHPA